MNIFLKKSSFLYIITILPLLILASSCVSDKKTKIESELAIVSVGDKTLYTSDILEFIPEGLTPEDSLSAVDAFIKKWINEELIYLKAKENLSDDHEIEELVEKYRHTLTVYSYLEKLLNEEISKKISETQLKEYYEKKSKELQLEETIIKGLFLKIPKSSNEVNNFKKWYKSNTTEAKENIDKASIQNTVMYDYFYDRWVDFDDISINIPTTVSNPDQFVKNNSNFETEDSLYVYLLHIEEYAISGNPAPYDYVRSSIEDIVINKNREAFLKQIETDLYNKAVNNKEVLFHKSEKTNSKK